MEMELPLASPTRYAESWKCLRKATSRNVLKHHGNFFRLPAFDTHSWALLSWGRNLGPLHDTGNERTISSVETCKVAEVQTNIDSWQASFGTGLWLCDFMPTYNSQCELLLPDLASRDYHLLKKNTCGRDAFQNRKGVQSYLRGGRALRFRHKDGTPVGAQSLIDVKHVFRLGDQNLTLQGAIFSVMPLVHLTQKCIDLSSDNREKSKLFNSSMPINMFFIVKNLWESYFMDSPRTSIYISDSKLSLIRE
ncbi:hypothetical protein TNCV_584661 [Trichonephila clavipes]|nr:hypothetical protein TNCV_584661 [Trichonephila clavipes]